MAFMDQTLPNAGDLQLYSAPEIRLSVVVGGRDDSYGDFEPFDRYDPHSEGELLTNMERISHSLAENLKQLTLAMEDSFEIVVVDWCPMPGKEVFANPLIQEITGIEKVRWVRVDRSAVLKRRLNPDSFYEYWAKNVGIRAARGEWVLVSNSDDYMSSELAASVREVVERGGAGLYYRCEARQDVVSLSPPLLGNRGQSFDDHHLMGQLGTGGSGDFILTKKKNWLAVGGFNETSSKHYSKHLRQSGLDMQAVLKLYMNGISPRKVEGVLYSLDHRKPRRVWDTFDTSFGYKNPETWGMADLTWSLSTASLIEVCGQGTLDHFNRKIRDSSAVIRSFAARRFPRAFSMVKSLQLHAARATKQ